MQNSYCPLTVDLASRLPAGGALAAGAGAAEGLDGRLAGHLAAAHDLTLAEAAEAISDWQSGLLAPAPSRAAA